MIRIVSDFIARHQLLSHDNLHVVALSGGADSVALLLILHQLGYRIEAAHCNFNLRGEESKKDEEFVKSLCKRLEIPLHLIHFETREYAAIHQVSIEMAARELRYNYFRQLCQDIGAATVCVAHHRDDAVETLLMNLLRGSGIHGLTGIRPKNGIVVRPLLGVRRQQIEDYLHSIGQEFVVDSTNLVDDVLRNKIRLQVLPLLRDISPRASDNIGRTADYLREAEKVYNDGIVTQKTRIINKTANGLQTVFFQQLTALPSPECFLHEWLAAYGFNATQVGQILSCVNGESGREFHSASHILVIDRDSLFLEAIQAPLRVLKIPEVGNYRYMKDLSVKVELLGDISISKSKECATLDAGKIEFPLTLRPIQDGDRFCPFGMEGHRLVSDYLTDCKLTLLQKRRQLVVTDCNGEIVWLVGLRTDHRFCVTEQTMALLKITFDTSLASSK